MNEKFQREILTLSQDKLISYCNKLDELFYEANTVAHNIASELAENREFAVSIVCGISAICSNLSGLKLLLEKDKLLLRVGLKDRED